VGLDHDATPPMRRTAREDVGRAGRFALTRDRVVWPGGDAGEYVFLRAPDSVFMVPLAAAGRTTLVRQWRYPWGESSWEVPAGTLEEGEDPLAGANRELAEEAGLEAADWTPLGVAHGSAVLDSRQHLFLARGLRPVERAPEAYERDMITRELPLSEALDEAMSGGIAHSGSIAALTRASWSLGLRLR